MGEELSSCLDDGRVTPVSWAQFDCTALDVDVRVGVDVTVIHLCGEGDVATAPLLTRALTHATLNGTTALVVLDLSSLTFLDASFLAVIARHRHCPGIHRIVLRSPEGTVARLLELVGWNDLIERSERATA